MMPQKRSSGYQINKSWTVVAIGLLALEAVGGFSIAFARALFPKNESHQKWVLRGCRGLEQIDDSVFPDRILPDVRSIEEPIMIMIKDDRMLAKSGRIEIDESQSYLKLTRLNDGSCPEEIPQNRLYLSRRSAAWNITLDVGLSLNYLKGYYFAPGAILMPVMLTEVHPVFKFKPFHKTSMEDWNMFTSFDYNFSGNNRIILEDFESSKEQALPAAGAYFHEFGANIGKDFIFDSLDTILDSRIGLRHRNFHSTLEGRTDGAVKSTSLSRMDRSPLRMNSMTLYGGGVTARTYLSGPHSLLYGLEYHKNFEGKSESNVAYSSSPEVSRISSGSRISALTGYSYETASGLKVNTKLNYVDYNHSIKKKFIDYDAIVLDHKKISLLLGLEADL